MQRRLLIVLELIVCTVAAYAQVATFDFVNFDDDVHVYANEHVSTGLTTENIVWAFGIHGPSQWHPLAWLSHQLDCELFGLKPPAHHWTNVALHVVSVVLLFLFWEQVTGATWPSAFVAAVFALHPLNVESVAWVSERRNVLCGVFWMLTLLAYGRYSKRPSLWRYSLVLASFALGIMSKPMVVTLPCVLLLLDFWPLGRVTTAFLKIPPAQTGHEAPLQCPRYSAGWLIVEKLPLLALSGVSSILTILCQQSAQVVVSIDAIPLTVRAANALAAYGTYLAKMFWPTKLAAFYPHPALFHDDVWPDLWPAAAVWAMVLTIVTVYAVLARQRRPYLLVGWLWFLGTLLPMIGLIQVGHQQFADRYTYVAGIGISMSLAWMCADMAKSFPKSRIVLPIAAVVLLTALVTVTWIQTGYWQNSITLNQRALAVTDRNHWAHTNLGRALAVQGRVYEAIDQYAQAIDIVPDYALAHYNLGIELQELNQLPAALHHFNEAVQSNPGFAAAHVRRGTVLGAQGKLEESITSFETALEIDPTYGIAHLNLAIGLERAGRVDEAIEHFRRAIEITPGDAKARFGLAVALQQRERWREAEQQLQIVLKLSPGFAAAHNMIAKVYLQLGDQQRAEFHFNKAARRGQP